MKIELHGYGKMGKLVEKRALERGHAFSSPPEVAIDFSVAEAVLPYLQSCVEKEIPLVIGTTGWNVEAGKKWVEREGGTVLYSPNFSLGIAYFGELIKQAIAYFPDAERAGLEIHHSAKKDCPSGTALSLSSRFAIPFSSLRLGTVAGKHEVFLETECERITLSHEAKNREGFALGALLVAEWIIEQKGWLTIDDYLHSTHYALQRR